MPTESFAERWARKERECEAPESELVACGDQLLPCDAAPCLTFEDAASPRRVWEQFGASRDWSKADRARLASYLAIGSDGAGNPICIDETTGAIWLLEHENHFQSSQFVNSNISHLAESLLAYMGEDEPERFRQAVAELDRPAMESNTFWWQEAATIGEE
jgi:hypothetical protein